MNRAQKVLTIICLLPFLLFGVIIGKGEEARTGLTACALILVAYVALFFVFKSPKQ